MPTKANELCNTGNWSGDKHNAMIHPYMVGQYLTTLSQHKPSCEDLLEDTDGLLRPPSKVKQSNSNLSVRLPAALCCC